MQKFTINTESDEKTLEQAVCLQFKQLKKNALFKAFRKKDIKLNGHWARNTDIVHIGDEVSVYIDDMTLYNEKDVNKLTLEVVYTDENIAIVNKPQGIDAHPGGSNTGTSFVDLLSNHFGRKMYLCHRLDRNTSGLMIVAKTAEAAACVNARMKADLIHKHYRCVTVGVPEPHAALETAYMTKDTKKNRMFVVPTFEKGSQEIVTKYKVLSAFEIGQNNDLRTNDGAGIPCALLDVELYTGRTHQIRAHMAYLGWPILGDGKYGDNQINRLCKAKKQLLVSYSLSFDKAVATPGSSRRAIGVGSASARGAEIGSSGIGGSDLLSYLDGTHFDLPELSFEINNSTITFP